MANQDSSNEVEVGRLHCSNSLQMQWFHIKKNRKKHTDATQIWVPSSYFGTEPFADSLAAFHFGQPNLFKFVKAHVRTFHKLIL